jgi:hypothetical protein
MGRYFPAAREGARAASAEVTYHVVFAAILPQFYALVPPRVRGCVQSSVDFDRGHARDRGVHATDRFIVTRGVIRKSPLLSAPSLSTIAPAGSKFAD